MWTIGWPTVRDPPTVRVRFRRGSNRIGLGPGGPILTEGWEARHLSRSTHP